MKDKQQLKDKAWEEYKKIWQIAWREYEKIQQPAWEEYEKKCREIDKIK